MSKQKKSVIVCNPCKFSINGCVNTILDFERGEVLIYMHLISSASLILSHTGFFL